MPLPVRARLSSVNARQSLTVRALFSAVATSATQVISPSLMNPIQHVGIDVGLLWSVHSPIRPNPGNFLKSVPWISSEFSQCNVVYIVYASCTASCLCEHSLIENLPSLAFLRLTKANLLGFYFATFWCWIFPMAHQICAAFRTPLAAPEQPFRLVDGPTNTN